MGHIEWKSCLLMAESGRLPLLRDMARGAVLGTVRLVELPPMRVLGGMTLPALAGSRGKVRRRRSGGSRIAPGRMAGDTLRLGVRPGQPEAGGGVIERLYLPPSLG